MTEEEKRIRRRASAKKYREKNRENVRELGRRWKKNNPEKVRASSAAFYQRNKEKHSQYGKEYYLKNKEKVCARTREHQRRNPEKRHFHSRAARVRKYGLTPEQYGKMLAEQNGKCWICHLPETKLAFGKVQSLCVDHDHETNAVRRLLCHRCNVVVGLLRENVSLAENFVEYLRRFKKAEAA